MRFVDLFAGLGGFHLALRELGHECVFASEIDETLRLLYERNFGMQAFGDIREIDAKDIPTHEILCAGFPCQPFSKAGRQSGLSDPHLGKLYLQILKVVSVHHPKYLILENVPNLEYHRDGSSWKQIRKRLQDEGYDVDMKRLSPHQYGIPQIRDRMYIVASRSGLDDFRKNLQRPTNVPPSLESVLLDNPSDSRAIPEIFKERLKVWQEFLDLVPKDEKIPHPLWSMEFGATYPFERTTPNAMTTEALRKYKGSFGRDLSEAKSREDIFELLPSHAAT